MATATAPVLGEQIDQAFEKAKTDNPVATPAPPAPPPAEKVPDPPASEPTQDKPQEKAPVPETSEEEPLGLTAEQLEEVRKDPKLAAAYKSMQRAFTAKTTELAKQRSTYEQYQPLIERYQANPQELVRELAKHHGVGLTEAAAAKVEAQADNVVESLKKSLGPELDFLADKLAPAIKEIVASQAKEVIAPLQQNQDAMIAENAAKQTEMVMAAFEKEFPDWKQHEKKMTEVMARYQPQGNTTEAEYLKDVYYLATRNLSEAQATRKVIEKLDSAAKSATSPTPAVPAQVVAKAAPAFDSLNDAIDQSFADAQRGIRYER